MEKSLSNKITIFSFFLLLLVVIIHCYNIEYDKSGNNEIWFIENLISNGYLNFVVPTFFFISGYLFFLNFELHNFNLHLFKTKILKRLKTLVIPYLFWCTFWFSFIYILQILPFTKDFFPSPLHKMDVLGQLYNLFLEPINYPFWFIRELFIYLIISPIIYLLLKYLKYYFLPILFLLASYKTSIINIIGIDLIKFEMITYFIFGSYCSLYRINIILKLNKYILMLLIVFWMIITFVTKYYELFIINNWSIILLSDIATLLGCLSIWLLYDFLDDKVQFKSYKVFSYGFFIFATHGIPILLLKKAESAFLVLNNEKLLILYFVNFLVITISAIFIGRFLKANFEKFYLFTTGNR